MLAHHGRKEWGSPVEPATNEAWILHAADMMSSREGALNGL
jgi:3'-5' exoribonuclease